MTRRLLSDVGKVRREMASMFIDAFARTYFKDYLKYALSTAHHEIYHLLQGALRKRGQRIALAGPRGLGKSTLATLIYLLYCVCYQLERFIVIISDTSDQAVRLLEIVRKELETNELLLEDFPELRGKRPSPWTQSEIETPLFQLFK